MGMIFKKKRKDIFYDFFVNWLIFDHDKMKEDEYFK
jgi:hypothetical protein